jgi:hypothetical protein
MLTLKIDYTLNILIVQTINNLNKPLRTLNFLCITLNKRLNKLLKYWYYIKNLSTKKSCKQLKIVVVYMVLIVYNNTYK